MYEPHDLQILASKAFGPPRGGPALLGSPGLSRALLGSPELSWALRSLRGFPGFSRSWGGILKISIRILYYIFLLQFLLKRSIFGQLAWGVLCGSPGLSSPGCPELSWAFLGSPELSRALLSSLGSPGLSWALQDSPGLSWARLSFLRLSGVCGALRGSPGLSRSWGGILKIPPEFFITFSYCNSYLKSIFGQLAWAGTLWISWC